MACPCVGATMMGGAPKKAKRHCPKDTASACAIGTHKKGADGKMYVVKKCASGKRWSAVSKSK